jgi:hypothetical protein
MNEAALKARLKFIAQEKLKTFNEVWKQLLLERFLARLSRSTYREQFIFAFKSRNTFRKVTNHI